MAKYEFDLSVGIKEVLDADSAKQVESKIKKQKAELEKPIEINVNSEKAEKRLKDLTRAAKQVKNDLQEAISSKQSFEEISKLVSKYNLLKKQIKDVTPEVNKNNASLKESNQILKDTKKIVDQLTVSQEKLNKTRKTKTTNSTKIETKNAKELVNATEDVIQTQEKASKAKLRTQSQVNAELDKELQKLKEIEAQQAKNEAARARLQKEKSHYGKEILGTDKAVYDTDLLKGASAELKEFNDLLNTRNKYQEKYNKLCRMVEKYYVSDYGISNGVYKNLDQFVEMNASMKRLDAMFEQGQKTTNKEINALFNDVVRELQSEGSMVANLISSGDAVGDLVGQALDKRESELNKEMQRLHEERQAQLTKINALRQEELDLIKKAGQEEKNNSKKLKFTDGTLLNETQIKAVEKYCSILKKSMGEAYNEARELKAALDLVFNIKEGNVANLMDRFTASNKASNAALQIMTGMTVNNQTNRDAALRSINPDIYDKIVADQKAAAEKAKAELKSQKSDFEKQWDEFVSTMLGGDAFKDESNLVKGKILKAFGSYGKTAKEAIEEVNKAWLKGELDGKGFKSQWVQKYVDHLNSLKEYYDELRNITAEDLDIDSLFGLGGTATLDEGKAQALRDEAAAWDELIAKKKEYYGIEQKDPIREEFESFVQQSKTLSDSFSGNSDYASKYLELVKQIEAGALSAADAMKELNAQFKAIKTTEDFKDDQEKTYDDLKKENEWLSKKLGSITHATKQVLGKDETISQDGDALDKELQKLKEIEEREKRNEAAREKAQNQRRSELVAELNRYDPEESYGKDDLQRILSDNERIIQTLKEENLLTDEIREKYEAISKHIAEQLILLQAYSDTEKKLIALDDLSDSVDMDDLEAVVNLLHQRKKLISEIPTIALDGTYDFPEQIDAEETINKSLEQRIELLKQVQQGLISIDDVDDLIKERGSLDDKLSRLGEFIYNGGFTEKPNKDDDISESLEEFEKVYDRIVLKLANGTSIKILPDLKGLNALAKFYDSYDGQYGESEIADVIFERVKATTGALLEQKDAVEQLTDAKTKSSKIKVREFASMDEYSSYQDKYRDEHSGENEYLENVVDIVPRIGKDFAKISADMTTSCKKAETAVRRFFSAIDPNKYPELAEWEPFLKEAMEGGLFKQADQEAGWAWEVQALDDNTYYVSVIAVTDAIKAQTNATEQLAEAQSKMKETAKLIGELQSKYGAEKFGEIFGDVGTIDISNAEKVYNTLITKEEEYFSAIQARHSALNEFVQMNGELATQYQESESFMGKFAELSQGILEGNIGLEDANKQLQEFVGTLSEAIEKQKDLFKAPKNNYEKLFNTLTLGDNAFETKSKGEVSGFSWADRETIAEALVNGLQQGLDEINLTLNNGKTTITFAGGVESAASLLDKLGFKAIESEITKFVGKVFKKAETVIYDNSGLGNYVTDGLQMYKLSRSLNGQETEYFKEFSPKNFSNILKIAERATESLPVDVREATAPPEGKKKKGDKIYIFKTEDGEYITVRKSLFDNVRTVSSALKYDPASFRDKQYNGMITGVGEDGSIVSGVMPMHMKDLTQLQQLFNSGMPIGKNLSENNKVLDIAGIKTVAKETKAAIDVTVESNKKATSSYEDLVDTIFKALKQIRELRNELRDISYSDIGADQKLEKHRELSSAVSNIEYKQFPYIYKAIMDDDFNPAGIDVDWYTTDEMLREMAQSIAVYASKSKEELGELQLIKIDTSGVELLNGELKNIVDNSGKAVDAYRGLAEEAKSNSILTTGHHSGATWFSTKQGVASGYTRDSDNLYRANLQSRRLLEIDANRSDWHDITFLGDGVDDVSKKITELYKKKQELKAEATRLAAANQTESQSYKDISSALSRVIADYEYYSNKLDNPYGTHDTNWYAKYAQKNGYDAVRIKNVYDTLQGGGLSDVIGVFSEEQILNVEKVVKAQIDAENKVAEIADKTVQTKQEQVEVENNAVKQTEAQVEAEKKLAEEARKAAEAKERQVVVSEKHIETTRNKTKALSLPGTSSAIQPVSYDLGAQQTSSNIEAATKAIEAEGIVAEQAAAKKDKFTDANKRVAQSGKATKDGVGAAAGAMENEGKSAKEYADQIINALSRMNSLNTEIDKLQGKNKFGFFSNQISSMQKEKAQLFETISSIAQEVNSKFNLGFDSNTVSANFFGVIAEFFKNTGNAAKISSNDVNKFVDAIRSAEKFAAGLAEKYQETANKIQTLRESIASFDVTASAGDESTKDNGSADYYAKMVENYMVAQTRYDNMTSNLSGKSPLDFTGEESMQYINAVDDITKYGEAIKRVQDIEREFFAGKKQYISGETTMSSMANDAENAANKTNKVKQELIAAAHEFAVESGASGAIITKFVQGADGISKLNFAVLENGTNIMHKFQIATGRASDAISITETSINDQSATIEKAAERLQKAQDLISKLRSQGIDTSGGVFKDLVTNVENLDKALTADKQDISSITKIAQECKASSSEAEKLYTKLQKLNSLRAEVGGTNSGLNLDDVSQRQSIETSIKAYERLLSVKELLGRIKSTGVNVNDGEAHQQIQKIINKWNELNSALQPESGASTTFIATLAKELAFLEKNITKTEQQILKMQEAIHNGTAYAVDSIDPNGDIYGQLTRRAQEYAAAQGNVTLEVGSFDKTTNTLSASLVHANGTVEQLKFTMYGLGGEVARQQAGMGKLTTSWDRFKTSIGHAGKQLITALVGYNVFFKAISEVRKGIGYVKEIDLALTELKKVTDETEASYKKFLNTAAGTAGEIGSTVSDFTEATANFARLGYTMEESADMAKTAIVYKNVADGLDTVEESTDSIISTMKAFGIESDDTMGIVDRFNEVGKHIAQIA